MMEFTLNYNHVQSVLGWHGHIFFPSQVIPLLIGAFGFIRIAFIRFAQWRSPEDIEPSLARDPTLPQRASTAPRGLGWLKVFTASRRGGTDPAAEHEDGDIDPCMEDRPLWLRYLVAWLPWLALTKWICADKMALPTFNKTYVSSQSPSLGTVPQEERKKRRETWGSDATFNFENKIEEKKP